MKRLGGETSSEVHFFYETVQLCIGKNVGRDVSWQVAPVMVSIPHTEGCIQALEVFDNALGTEIPNLALHGRRRALKAFVRTADTITKPSYIARLNSGAAWGTASGQKENLL